MNDTIPYIEDDITPMNNFIDPSVTNNLIDKAFSGNMGIIFVVLVGVIAFFMFMFWRKDKAKEKSDERTIQMAEKVAGIAAAQRDSVDRVAGKVDNVHSDVKQILNRVDKNGNE